MPDNAPESRKILIESDLELLLQLVHYVETVLTGYLTPNTDEQLNQQTQPNSVNSLPLFYSRCQPESAATTATSFHKK